MKRLFELNDKIIKKEQKLHEMSLELKSIKCGMLQLIVKELKNLGLSTVFVKDWYSCVSIEHSDHRFKLEILSDYFQLYDDEDSYDVIRKETQLSDIVEYLNKTKWPEKSYLLANIIQTPDGTILHSRHQHDFVSHTDKNGKYYANDGGNAYKRRSVESDQKDISVYSTSPFEQIREWMVWGTRGKKGDQPIKYVKLKDLTLSHIKNIIKTQNIPKQFKQQFERELEYRKNLKSKQK